MAEALRAHYGEVPVIAGISDGNTPILIFANPDTGTFSIAIRRPGGITCLLIAGTSWTPIEREKKGTPL